MDPIESNENPAWGISCRHSYAWFIHS